MRFLFITLVLIALSLPAFADIIGLKSCMGTTQYHLINIEQIGKDIHASIEDKKFNNYSDIGNSSEEKFKVSGKEKSMMVLHSIDLQTFMKTRSLAREFMVALIIGRPEFRGEEDIIYSYAENFLRSLSCK